MYIRYSRLGALHKPFTYRLLCRVIRTSVRLQLNIAAAFAQGMVPLCSRVPGEDFRGEANSEAGISHINFHLPSLVMRTFGPEAYKFELGC